MITDVREIERVPLTHVDDVEAEMRGDVLARAHKLFGYCADSFRASGPLAAALSDLSIHPLRSEQVNDYMESKKRTITFHTLWLALPLLYGVVMAYWLVMHHIYGNWDINSWSFAAAFCGTLGSVLGCVFFTGFLIAACPTYERKSEWRWYTLGVPSECYRNLNFTKYPRYVPIHVLNMAVEIKEKLRQAELYVCELKTTTNKLQRPDPDPFLHVKLGLENYWIAVWDEREFEAKM